MAKTISRLELKRLVSGIFSKGSKAEQLKLLVSVLQGAYAGVRPSELMAMDVVVPPKPRRVPAKPRIYLPEDLQMLVHYLWQRRKDSETKMALHYLVLQAFAGLRPSEVIELDWSSIDFSKKQIHVDSAQSKVERVVPMKPNLAEFLLSYRKSKGLVVPAKLIAVVLASFWKKTGVKHIPEGLRHSFATYSLVTERPEKVQAEMGVSSQLVKRRFLKPVSSAVAAKYWAIVPPSK